MSLKVAMRKKVKGGEVLRLTVEAEGVRIVAGGETQQAGDKHERSRSWEGVHWWSTQSPFPPSPIGRLMRSVF
jgi:hypothetical protein